MSYQLGLDRTKYSLNYSVPTVNRLEQHYLFCDLIGLLSDKRVTHVKIMQSSFNVYHTNNGNCKIVTVFCTEFGTQSIVGSTRQIT